MQDGVYSGDFVPQASGYYSMQTVVQGRDANGAAFVRTAEHVVDVVANSIAFTGDARSANGSTRGRPACPTELVIRLGRFEIDEEHQRLAVHLGVNENTANVAPATYRAFAQVWGHSLETQEEVPSK